MSTQLYRVGARNEWILLGGAGELLRTGVGK